MRFYSITFAILLVACGCSSPSAYVDSSHATINDVAVPAPKDSGYQVVAVDGKLVQRKESSVVTVVPYAIVQPGKHTLSLAPQSGNDLEALTVSAEFEAGKQYRLKLEDGVVTVIEDTD